MDALHRIPLHMLPGNKVSSFMTGTKETVDHVYCR